MPEEPDDPVIGQVISERAQDHKTRKRLFLELEAELGRPVVTLFTSFNLPVGLEDTDVDMIAGVLQKLDLSKGLAVVISSPGGDGLSSERMINVCRGFSGTGDYWAVVPGKAKSAATMVCFGAAKILMGPASELGPVDPQIPISQDEMIKWFSAFNIIESYKELFEGANKAQGNLEPYLQQLARYDARDIKQLNSAIELSDDISVNALATGMLAGQDPVDIRKGINPFLTQAKKSHGRPIYAQEAKDCGLIVENMEPGGKLWELVYELYIRTNDYVSTQVSKCIESRDHSFIVPRA